MPVKKNKEISKVSEEIKKSPLVHRNYKIAAIAAIVAIAMIIIAYLFKGVFIAAIVNGRVISRLSVINELESRGGKQALDGQITNIIILQEAQKRQITISDKQVNDQIKKIINNLDVKDKEFDQLLAAQGLTKETLNNQVRLELIITKLLEKELAVKDKEIDEYIKTNQDSLPKDASPEQLRKQISEQLKQQKMGEGAQKLIEKLKKDAKIVYYSKYN